jgi:hypothetical protein
MRMGIGLGVGINRSNYAQGIFSAYQSRVVADGGITEAGNCVNAVSSLLQSASLLLIPSGYKGGKAYAEIPTNGNGDLTWTRASDAWRTNADGLIQRVPWNLISQSEAFDTASWSKSNITITANSITAPNGTTTADSMFEQAVNGLHNIRQSITVISGSTYTLSAYVKANGRDWCIMVAGAGGNGYYFNIASGSVGSQTGGTGTVSNPQIQSVGDGWYRISFQLVAGSTTQGMELWTSTGNGNFSFLGDVTKGLYIWGAQLVEGSSAQTYFPTTDRLNVPRLSYMYGSCPALLLEPQRTNLALQSESFDNASWTKANASVTANSTTAPDGNTTADTFESTTNINANITIQQAITIVSGSTYSASFYVKANTQRYIFINLSSTGAIQHFVTAVIDTNDFTVGQTAVGTSSGTLVTTNIQSAANGFYRITIVASINRTDGRIRLGFADAKTGNFIGLTGECAASNTSGKSVYLWGAQMELGAYATTIIPTTTASATRIADSFSRNNIYTNGLITSSGGTWFVELRGNVSLTRDTGANLNQSLGITDSSGNGIVLRSSGTQRHNISKYIANTPTELFVTTTDTVKIAIKWNGSTMDIFQNGSKVVSASTFTTTNLNTLGVTTSDIPKFIQAMALYPTPLSDTDCTTITTL